MTEALPLAREALANIDIQLFGSVTAPSLADPTSAAYFASTPER
jgi:hypothetical protein